MSKVLVISGHPDLSQSHTNQVILSSLDNALSNVEIRRLDTLYPNYDIDVEAEQNALLSADIVVLQFPFYWYSVPALLKKWIDDVFSYDFAYGTKGDKLQGKSLILSFTVGGPKESYDPLGYNHFTIEQLIKPLQQTAYLAKMDFQSPIYSHGMVYIPGVYNELSEVQSRAQSHATRLLESIECLSIIDEQYIKRFARTWFREFDKMPAQSDFFTQYLSDDVTFIMPEGSFVGHSGFNYWYELAKKQFKPNCDHQIQAMSVVKTSTGFEADLTVSLTAETFEDSPFNGETLTISVSEKWQFNYDQANELKLTRYEVAPL